MPHFDAAPIRRKFAHPATVPVPLRRRRKALRRALVRRRGSGARRKLPAAAAGGIRPVSDTLADVRMAWSPRESPGGCESRESGNCPGVASRGWTKATDCKSGSTPVRRPTCIGPVGFAIGLRSLPAAAGHSAEEPVADQLLINRAEKRPAGPRHASCKCSAA